MREMKDSNYGYLGIVPQSWKVDKIKAMSQQTVDK